MPVEYCATQERPQNLWQKQIGHRAQLISRGGMPSHIDSQTAQLLNETPNLGAARGNFLRDLGAADHDHGVLHEQAHDAAKALVRGLLAVGRRRAFRRFSHTSFDGFADAEIMREACGKNNAFNTSWVLRFDNIRRESLCYGDAQDNEEEPVGSDG